MTDKIVIIYPEEMVVGVSKEDTLAISGDPDKLAEIRNYLKTSTGLIDLTITTEHDVVDSFVIELKIKESEINVQLVISASIKSEFIGQISQIDIKEGGQGLSIEVDHIEEFEVAEIPDTPVITITPSMGIMNDAYPFGRVIVYGSLTELSLHIIHSLNKAVLVVRSINGGKPPTWFVFQCKKFEIGVWDVSAMQELYWEEEDISFPLHYFEVIYREDIAIQDILNRGKVAI